MNILEVISIMWDVAIVTIVISIAMYLAYILGAQFLKDNHLLFEYVVNRDTFRKWKKQSRENLYNQSELVSFGNHLLKRLKIEKIHDEAVVPKFVNDSDLSNWERDRLNEIMLNDVKEIK